MTAATMTEVVETAARVLYNSDDPMAMQGARAVALAALAAALAMLKRPITRADDPTGRIRDYLFDRIAELDALAEGKK